MIEEAIHRLAAAIEVQNTIQTINQRLFALLVERAPVTPAAVEVVSESPAPKAKTSAKKSVSETVTKTSEPDPAPRDDAVSLNVSKIDDPVREPEAETSTRPVNKEDLTKLAMGLSRQDNALVPSIKAALRKHGAKTITELADDKVGEVFTELNALAHKI